MWKWVPYLTSIILTFPLQESFIFATPTETIGIAPCLLPIDYGNCTSYVHKWYYNVLSRKCEIFVYGGCAGNANRFDSQNDCLRICQNAISACGQDRDEGYCNDYKRFWYFDRQSQTCTPFIFGGCGGNNNRFATKDDCQRSCLNYRTLNTSPKPPTKKILQLVPTPAPLESINEYCYQRPSIGSCTSRVHKWFFNPETKSCETFIYSGCGGNKNRFDALMECQYFCISTAYTLSPNLMIKHGFTQQISPTKSTYICSLEQDVGTCENYSEKWFFNRAKGLCEMFIYGGCEGNANRFNSEQDCQETCSNMAQSPLSTESPHSLPRCQQPLDYGNCTGYVHKWYYNSETQTCNTFVYGGCDGNQNRFDSELSCWQSCFNENATYAGEKGASEKTTTPNIGHTFDETHLIGAYEFQNGSTDQVRMDMCLLKPYRGPCKDHVYKWFYNVVAKECKLFVYGGCYGNGNRFDTRTECMHFCSGDTLPPYLRQQNIERMEEFRWADGQWQRIRPTLPTVPIEARSEKLTFPDTGNEKTFMFALNNAFIQLDSTQIPTFQLRLCREISFEFRTKLPHGLLVYHGIKNRPEGLSPYALYIIVEKGQLKVVHVFGKHSTSVIVGEGLNRDKWHSVNVRIDVYKARLFAQVDNKSAEVDIKGLNHRVNYGVTTDLTSVVLIGGLSPEEKLHGVKYIIESFVGCIRDVVLKAGKAALELLPIRPLIASKHENVQEGCINKCRTRENLCFEGSRCVNHYNGLTCDCFGTLYEGEHCDVYTATILTFRGSTYVSYRVYDWRDRVHSSENRISLFFKTRYDDSALFYASGETAGKPHHIAASIKNGSVVLDINFGDGSVVASLGTKVNSNMWNNLTIYHRGPEILVALNQEAKILDAPGDLHHLSIDPEIYIGGGPELGKKKGLVSNNNFAGSLKYVFYNDISILYELHKGNPKVHYIGVLDPEFTESDVEVIPITFPFPSAHVWWSNRLSTGLNISFHFKSARSYGVLTYSEITTKQGHGFWQLRIVNDEVRFELVVDSMKNVTHVTTVKYMGVGWHTVDLIYRDGEVKLNVDLRTKESQLTSYNLGGDTIVGMGDKIIIGSGDKKNAGFVGCMRLIRINGEQIEPRYAVRSIHAGGDVSLDNCQLVDPCKRPNACEHGGKCSVDVDKVVCDCVGTGYIGKNCHFAEFRKTCEELALLGYTKPDVYLIDIDGNGRFPPAHVKCEFPTTEDSTKTIVEHNLPSQVDVRSSSETDFSFSIKYREFTAEMLQELISHSLYCSQHIKYDCYKAPLDLHSATWFISSSKNKTVDYIGDVKRGSCPCGMNRTCVNPMQSCNCDISEAKWHSDEGHYSIPHSLGITEMVFLQQKELAPDGLGRITLGPLECVEANTQKYVVTFTTSQSYIEVPGWRKGDIAFSFRTTGEKAILLYQPPIRPNYPSFMVALTSDFQLTFNFTLNTGRSRELEIKSRRKLNGGEWQKIWIDYNEHHVRFMINTDYQMVDLLPEEEFGPFEGSMFIGGATEDLLKKGSVTQGLIGCFRGLVVNGEILDIYSYMSVHLSEIIKDCKPTCDPNPCKNGAMCRELWSKYECVCENPWAHVGEHCEENINTHALTFLRPETYLRKIYIRNIPEEKRDALQTLPTQNLLINLRSYDENALVLYINDNLNNFIQLHIHSGRFVVFLFNDANQIKNLEIEYPDIVSGKSVQVAVIRTPGVTTLHVNEKNISVPSNHRSILTYSNRPWINPEKEVLAPQRPPAPPVEYYQVNLGGYDPLNLRKMTSLQLPGYVGCIRGFKLGNYLIDLEGQLKSSNTDERGVIPGCRIKCDEKPCQHQGICTEDFVKGESTCNCEHTSYYGEFCNEEKGAEFSGESRLQRQFILHGTVNSVKVQLAFSSTDIRQKKVILLLVQTDNRRSYYLLVAITPEGHLLFEEDREDSAFGAKITDTNFLNGARHSIYYLRTGSEAVLLIDREVVPLEPMPVLSISEYPESVATGGANEVQIGGLNTTDPRFRSYQPYSGCLSNVLVEVNGNEMKPLEEYMAFIKTGSEKIGVQNSGGIRSAQCSVFDVSSKLRLGPSLNISLGTDKVWVEDPPARIAYKSLYSDSSTVEEGTGRVVVIVLISLFVMIVLSAIYTLWRADRRYRRRKELAAAAANHPRMWRERVSFNEHSVKTVTFKKTPKRNSGASERGLVTNEYVPLQTSPGEILAPNGNLQSDSKKDMLDREKLTTQTITEEEADATSATEERMAEADENQNNEELVLRNYEPKFARRKCLPIPEEVAYSQELMAMGFRPGAGQKIFPEINPGPVFLPSGLRQFGNPISYLGGPKLDNMTLHKNQPSKESLTSLD